MIGLSLLAVIRGDRLQQELGASAPVVTFDDAPSQVPSSGKNFYEQTASLLQLVTLLLAVAMELEAGIALHEAWRLGSDDTEDWDEKRKRLAEVRRQLGALASEITRLQNEPQVFSNCFWRNFHYAIIVHSVRSAMSKLLLAGLVFLTLSYTHLAAQTRTTIVITLDFSLSVVAQSPDPKSEFQKNIDAVTQQLANVPADSRVTVIGITNHSFTQPDILLSTTVPADPGYFGERLNTARRELVRVWKTRTAKLEAKYRETDILGALLLASQIFEQESRSTRKTLVIYSDMRQNTKELDLESPSTLPRYEKITVAHDFMRVDLSGVDVYISGVDGAGKTIAYWQSLKRFRADYFENARGSLKVFSALRPTVESH